MMTGDGIDAYRRLDRGDAQGVLTALARAGFVDSLPGRVDAVPELHEIPRLGKSAELCLADPGRPPLSYGSNPQFTGRIWKLPLCHILILSTDAGLREGISPEFL